jgi:hypothetical protein
VRQIKKVAQDLEPLACKDEKNLKAGLKKRVERDYPSLRKI